MGQPLLPLPLLVRLSRETVRVIRQNILIFAFAVNGVGILLTAWLWPFLVPREWEEKGPIAAVIYHQLGSLAVLLNAMRLLWFERGTSSRTWLGIRARLHGLDRWMEHNLNLGEIAHALGHHWKKAAFACAGLVLLAYAWTGLAQIGPDERAVLRHFGKPVADLGPGLHWHWPWPVEDIVRVKPDQVHTVEIGFRSLPNTPSQPAEQGWSSPHAEGARRVPDEAVMITGDGNLVELQATVRYTISDARIYLFEVNDPDEIIRAAAESVLREAVASRPFLDLLSANRQQLQDEVFVRLAGRYRAYAGNGLGIALDGISLHDLHPPQEVVESYHNVAQAMQSRNRLVNEAKAEATRTATEAATTSVKMVTAAEAAKHETITRLETEVAAARARFRARTELTVFREIDLMLEAFSVVAKSKQTSSAAYADVLARLRTDASARQAELTDFRMVWDALATALARREKVLIDSDKVHGRLTLVDPALLRSLAPLVLPDRSRPSRTKNENGP
jgi:Cu+-exporting ATPase